jgi:hypothetical protein
MQIKHLIILISSTKARDITYEQIRHKPKFQLSFVLFGVLKLLNIVLHVLVEAPFFTV